MKSLPVVNGIHVTYSNVNQAWFVLWHTQVLSVHNAKEDAVYEYNRILSTIEKPYKARSIDAIRQDNWN